MNDGFDTTDLLIAIAALIVTVIIWYRKYHAGKRSRAARRFAQAHGWTFNKSSSSLVTRWRSAPFDQGANRRASNVLSTSVRGREIVSFEYEYQSVGSKEYRKTFYHHVVALTLPVPLPWLRLSHDGSGAAVAKLFGGQDVDFELGAFNDAWRVQGPPGQYAHDFLHPRMMERLLAPDAPGTTITVEGSDIYLSVSGPQDLEAIDRYVDLLRAIDELIPRHLWLKVGHDPATVAVSARPS